MKPISHCLQQVNYLNFGMEKQDSWWTSSTSRIVWARRFCSNLPEGIFVLLMASLFLLIPFLSNLALTKLSLYLQSFTGWMGNSSVRMGERAWHKPFLRRGGTSYSPICHPLSPCTTLAAAPAPALVAAAGSVVATAQDCMCSRARCQWSAVWEMQSQHGSKPGVGKVQPVGQICPPRPFYTACRAPKY